MSPSGTSAVFWLLFNHSMERETLNLQSTVSQGCLKWCFRSKIVWWNHQCRDDTLLHHGIENSKSHISLCRFHTASQFKGFWCLGLWHVLLLDLITFPVYFSFFLETKCIWGTLIHKDNLWSVFPNQHHTIARGPWLSHSRTRLLNLFLNSNNNCASNLK